MPRLLVFQHVAYEILGTLDPLLREHGFRIRYLNFGREPDAVPNLDRYDGLVVLGGSMNVDEADRFPHLHREIEALRRALDRELPILGICLGAQLLAAALGAEVGPGTHTEIGWFDVSPTPEARGDPLVGGFGESERLFQWHRQSFELPANAVHLASSPTCANQAFRHGHNAYGFQFHLEVDARLIERWLTVPQHRDELAAVGGEPHADAVRREIPERIERVRRVADETFSGFIGLFGEVRRRPHGPHAS